MSGHYYERALRDADLLAAHNVYGLFRDTVAGPRPDRDLVGARRKGKRLYLASRRQLDAMAAGRFEDPKEDFLLYRTICDLELKRKTDVHRLAVDSGRVLALGKTTADKGKARGALLLALNRDDARNVGRHGDAASWNECGI